MAPRLEAMDTTFEPRKQLLSGVIAVAASVGLALPAAAMAAPAVEQQPAPAPSTGDCTVEQIAEDIGVPEMDTVMYCDGEWAQVGKWQTDYILNPHWEGDQWVVPPYDGIVTQGLMNGCYTQEHIDELGGAPDEANLVICDPANSTLY